MWNQLTKDFPNVLYYLEPVYLNKDSANTCYIYVQYYTYSGKLLNIVLKVSVKERYTICGEVDVRGFAGCCRTLADIMRWLDLIDYRYVESYRKSKYAI